MRMLVLPLSATLLSTLAWAAPPTTSFALEATLTGCWSGTLQYRDYQSNQMVDLPVNTRISAVGDHRTFVRESRFDEGAKRMVYITTLTQFSRAGDAVTYVSSRIGSPLELTTDEVVVESVTDLTHWHEQYRRVGLDGDAESDIRVDVTRDGDRLVSEKYVKGVGEAADALQLRNRTDLRLLTQCED
jgi:hypothetical protein